MDFKEKSVGARRRISNFLKRCWEPTGPDAIFSWIMRPVVLVVVLIGLVVWYYCKPEAATFVASLIGGLLLLAQVRASSQRGKAAEDTVNLIEKGNIAERFKNAIEHLGHTSTSIRMGGIYALHHIAQDVEDYRKRVFQILCAHIRETTTQKEYKPQKTLIPETDVDAIYPSIEIQSILDLLFILTPECEIYKKFRTNLEHANLIGAILINSDLQNAILLSINLEGAILRNANLQGASLYFSNLQKAWLHNTNLQGADLSSAKNLTAEQLLTAKTLYQAELPEGMEAEIKQHKPELLDKPKPDNEQET